MPYALNIFAGTKLFGRDLVMKYRNASKNQESPSSPSSSTNPLVNAFALPNVSNNSMMPTAQQQQYQPFITQEMIQQRLLQIATLPDFGMQSFNSFPTSISFNSDDLFPSTRNDNSGSHRERRNDDRNEFVERSRNHREDNRNNRSRPYRRSRSRSPLHSRDRNRDRSPPTHSRDRHRDNNRGSGDNKRGSGNYSRWNY